VLVQDTEAEAAFRAQVHDFLSAFAPAKDGPGDYLAAYKAGRLSHADYIAAAKAWQRLLAEHGWAGITWPQEYGGRGGTGLDAAIFAEEEPAFGVYSGVFSVGMGMAGPAIMAHGTEEQKSHLLPAILSGEKVWCQLFSEPGAGSDLAGVSTRAVRTGNEWIVNGQKVWTSGAHDSDLGILLARTDLDVPKHRGMTFFLCDMDDPGIEIRPIPQMNGDAEFNEVFFTDVRVPHERVLGEVGQGWAVAMTTLASERLMMGGMRVGLAFDDLRQLAEQHGRTKDPAIRQALASAYIDLEIIRYLGMRVRVATSRGQEAGAAANVMKLFKAWQLKRISDTALRIQGAAGMLAGPDAPSDGAWQHHFLTSPSIRISGGSDEVQRNIIGERVLGLPPEPRFDKNVPFRQVNDRVR